MKVIPNIDTFNYSWNVYELYKLYKNINSFCGFIEEVDDWGEEYSINWVYVKKHGVKDCSEIGWTAWIPAEQLLPATQQNKENLKQRLEKEIRKCFESATKKEWKYWFTYQTLCIAHEFGYKRPED